MTDDLPHANTTPPTTRQPQKPVCSSLTSPVAVMGNTLTLLFSKWPLAVMLGTFAILAVVYWLLKQLTLAVILYWRTRHLRTAQRYWT